jgi:protein MpaA
LEAAEYQRLFGAWKALRATHNVQIREVACVNAPRTLLFAQTGSERAHIVSLSAGMHGDEPAGPWALLSLVRDGLLDKRFAYRIWPCLNPSGFTAGTRQNAAGDDINRSFSRGGTTPEARAIITANRDRKFALSIDLHEDFEAEGFYAYETLAPSTMPYYARRIANAVGDAGFPLQDLSDEAFDLGPPGARSAQTIERGCVIVDAKAESVFFTDGLPMSLFLARGAAARALTFETPRSRRWDERIEMHRIAVTTALANAG